MNKELIKLNVEYKNLLETSIANGNLIHFYDIYKENLKMTINTLILINYYQEFLLVYQMILLSFCINQYNKYSFLIRMVL